MFGKMKKLISVLLMLAMLANGSAVFAEEIIMIVQDGFEEIFVEEEIPAEETEEESEFGFEELTLEIEEEAEEAVVEEEEDETDLAQIPMTLAGYDANGFWIEDGVLKYYNGPGGHVVIPAGVTEIGDAAFYDTDGLTGVTIPDSVTKIGERAFYYCTELTNIIIPESVTSIGADAFYNCVKLARVEIRGRIDRVNDDTFNNCAELKEIFLPDSVTGIGERAFRYCDDLISVVLPDSVKKIDSGAFRDCTKLESIVLPDGLESIGQSAFSCCYNLISVNIPATVASIGDYAFVQEHRGKLNLVVDKDSYAADWCKENEVFYIFSGDDYKDSFTIKNGIATHYTGNEAVVNVPKGVTAIGKEAFDWVDNLGPRSGIEKVVLPEGLKSIGEFAFAGCENLKEVNFPSSLKSVNYGAFDQCGFTEVTVPKTLKFTMNDGGMFQYCENLEKVTLQQGLTSMGYSMFNGCENLKEVYIPSSVKSVGGASFENCESLETVVLAEGVKEIEWYAFANCTSLSEVVIPNTVKTIMQGAFESCYSLTELTIPASVTKIEKGAFKDCSDELVIECVAGSAAHKFCKKYKIQYKTICNHKWNSAKTVVAATCTEAGEKTRSCKTCGEKETLTVPAKGHKEVTLKAVKVSCKQDGLSEGKKCSTCGEILVEQIVTPALPHDIVIDAYIAPSETVCGRTEGSHCAVCKTVLVPQEVIPGLMPTIGLVNKSTKGITINVGEYWLLQPEYAETKGWEITKWSTSAKKIATVDKDGVVYAKAEGSVTITASAGKNKTMTVKLKIVDPKKPTKVSLNLKGTQPLNLGETLELEALLTPETAEAKFSWKSSSKKIATVSAEGVVTPIAEGTATITVTATRGKVKKTASVKVKVVDPLKLTKVTLDKTGTQTLAKGETLTLNPTLNPEGTEATIKWKSSNKSVASVKDGVITANKKGKAVITVTAVRGKVTKTAKVTIQVK